MLIDSIFNEVEEGSDNAFAGSLGDIDDLQKINVASPIVKQPIQPFFNWLDEITSLEKGVSFYDWLSGERK